MFEIMKESGGKTVGVRAEGKLTDKDYKEVLIPALDMALKEHGKLDLLFYMEPGFKGWDVEAAWNDALYGLKHRADFRKLAIVGGPDWVHRVMKLSSFLLKGEVRTFSDSELDLAWTWVRQ